MSRILPVAHQAPLPVDRLLRKEPPGAEAIEMDVLFVGAGPAGLAGAIELARLAQADEALAGLEIGVLEKAGSLGEHSLSGAVVNPRAFRELFPDVPVEELPFRQPVGAEAVYVLTERSSLRIPTPPTMKNHGNHVASLCEIVRWLGERAEGLGVNIFPGFPVESLLVKDRGVVGVRTTPTGLDRDGNPGDGYGEPTELTAKVTVLSEGTRGALAQAWLDWQGVGAPNPQIYALGVKEVWEVRRPLDRVIHTLGWPLARDAFGGTFAYPMGEKQVALGLVVGLDAADAGLDVHELLQRLKLHPLFRPLLDGGELVEWGAKTIPEGGYYSLPERFSGDGLVLTGDCLGTVEVASLKGIHYAMQSGMYAARAIAAALKAGDVSASGLVGYDRQLRASYVARDLHRRRNMRLAFKRGFVRGGVESVLLTLTGGRFPGGQIHADADAAEPREPRERPAFAPDGVLTFSKVDAVFKSGNATRDTIPSHLVVGSDVSGEVADFYARLCPAGVYERVGDELRVNPPNCVDCKATDVVGPRWTPREGGSGPKYRVM